MTNRAWVVREHGEPLDALRLESIDDVPLGPAQIRIRTRAAALGLPDVFMCRGVYPLTPQRPFVPGQEVAGVVIEAGPEASTPEGTRVMAITDFVHGRGGFAEFAVADDHNVFAIPDSMGDAEAAGFLIAFLTAWIGLVRGGRLAPRDHVLVLGAAGGTGAAAVRLAHALGSPVIAVANGADRVAHCRSLGADHVIDRSTTTDVAEAVRSITNGRGADVVYDPVGGEPGEAALRCVASEGRFLAVGFAAGAWPKVEPHRIVRGNFAFVGVYPGGYDRAARVEMVDALLGLVAEGRLDLSVDASPFNELPSALTRVAAGTARGRAVAVVER